MGLQIMLNISYYFFREYAYLSWLSTAPSYRNHSLLGLYFKNLNTLILEDSQKAYLLWAMPLILHWECMEDQINKGFPSTFRA